MKPAYILFALIIFVTFSAVSCSTGKSSQNIIDEDVYIQTEDTRLFANIRSNDSLSPVLLYMHGGPGSPLGVPLFKAYTGTQLEDDFIVVYLHQRGIMKSDRVDDDAHTLSNYVNDIHDVVHFLKHRFKGHDIYLLGHSWGGLISYLYLLTYKNEVDKFVAVCVPLDIRNMMQGRIYRLLKWALETNNQQAIKELKELQNKSDAMSEDETAMLTKWMTQAYGGWHRNLDMNRVNKAIDYEEHISGWLKEQKHIESILKDEILSISVTDLIQNLDVPLLCIAGKEDTDVPWYLVKEEFENYGGPKTFRLFEKSHHMVFIDEETLFVETVVAFLKTNR